jgi:hypothetical protein
MSCSQYLSGSVPHYTDSRAYGFKPHRGSLGKETSNTTMTRDPPGSHLESQSFQRALEIQQGHIKAEFEKKKRS